MTTACWVLIACTVAITTIEYLLINEKINFKTKKDGEKDANKEN